ncbi:hypothetical protein RB3055 [Rhodopirellula baltica SH 1]|uniref:Uncharacterized protein n=1 Tax=Rhodopirellula baltica (strain DSM 10527 / NCIMB 13988 / SH1) TaxID=243090 RepID=Q7UUU6_RHOBA|nr:hypothetical protein RB3055 [Rhodopirellula baltica SH 1]
MANLQQNRKARSQRRVLRRHYKTALTPNGRREPVDFRSKLASTKPKFTFQQR